MRLASSRRQAVVGFLRRRWFLLALIAILAAGFTVPCRLQPLATRMPRSGIVVVVLLLMAVSLEARAMWRVLSRPLAPALAVLINYGLLPPLAYIVAKALPAGLAEGIMIASVAPSTMASAAVWTRKAGGNDAVALMVTMVTNAGCFIVAPAWLLLMMGGTVDIPAADMAWKLGWLVVLPLLLGQLLRTIRPIGDWASGHKMWLSLVAQLGILSMVFVGCVKSGVALRQPSLSASAVDWSLMLAAAAGLHCVALWTGYVVARRLRMPRGDCVAVAIAGSQKTLMVGLWLATEYTAQFGELAVVPMLAYHVLQLLIDTVVAERWRDLADTARRVESG